MVSNSRARAAIPEDSRIIGPSARRTDRRGRRPERPRERRGVVMNDKLALALAVVLGAFLVLAALFLVFGPPLSLR